MARRYRISCVSKTHRAEPDERIRRVGGTSADGTTWSLALESAIGLIENGDCSFYVERPPGNLVDVVVAVSARHRKYLKTSVDNDQPDSLLSLPECS